MLSHFLLLRFLPLANAAALSFTRLALEPILASQVPFQLATDEIDSFLSTARHKDSFPFGDSQTWDNQTNFDITQYWGNLSPFEPVKSFGLENATPKMPKGCRLHQAFLLHRHGARYPTEGSAPVAFAAKHSAVMDKGSFVAKGAADFLNTWNYNLGEDALTPFGRSELFNLGVRFRVKYGELLDGFKEKLVFRTTSQGRMLDSALNFAAGFFGAQTFRSDYSQLVTFEASGYNNTLAPWSCANALKVDLTASTHATQWANAYLRDALIRLSPLMPGFDLTVNDLYAMQQICAYKTVAFGYSPFCRLFTKQEWIGHKYYNDLWFWYSYGPGSPTNSALGIGYVQELVSRLTRTPITEFNSSVNSTIVTDPTLFPLWQPLFVDATHDTLITAVLTAMNFTSLAANGPLSAEKAPDNQTYFVNQMAPFASNLVGQVLSCAASSTPTSIRWILNDGVLPTTGIAGCEPNSDGLCDLDTFIGAMKQRISEVDFQYACKGNYTIPLEQDDIVDGMPPRKVQS